MRMSDALAITKFWLQSPPEGEMLALLASVYTSWRPGGQELTEEEAIAAHRRSLEERWKGGAMNAKQFFEATGGRMSVNPMPPST
ncbi:MAG: hypothetical protein ACP5P4_08035 [Steroidobacteraceae bacterium]